jgi:hypothetical protein
MKNVLINLVHSDIDSSKVNKILADFASKESNLTISRFQNRCTKRTKITFGK